MSRPRTIHRSLGVLSTVATSARYGGWVIVSILWLPGTLANGAMPRPVASLPQTQPLAAARPSDSSRLASSVQLGAMPLYFIENRGQLDDEVAYYVQGRDNLVAFTSRGVTFNIAGPSKAEEIHRPGVQVQQSNERGQSSSTGQVVGGAFGRSQTTPFHALTIDFVEGNRGIEPFGKDSTPAVVSYFSGPRERWKTELKTFNKLVYPDLWPGIDLVYSGTVNRLKYTFLLKAGSDPEHIRLAYRGATALRVTETGRLQVSTPVGDFYDEKPYVYQELNGKRQEVAASYVLAAGVPSTERSSPSTAYEYGFRLGDYDRSQPLVLDPAFLVYAGYIGGGGNDRGLGIAVDSSRNVYVTGSTFSFSSASDDVYVAKLNSSGTALIYLGLIGGAGYDAAFDIAVDASGNAYVTGATDSSQSSFPVGGGPDSTYNGGIDAFISKLNAEGTALIYTGYIGGNQVDFGEGIVVDNVGNAYVTGVTRSAATGGRGALFPATVGPDLTLNGSYDVFVAKVKAVPNDPTPKNNFHYCGYIGGAANDVGVSRNGFITSGHIAIDVDGNAYISGMTKSTQTTFPDGDGFGSLPGPDQTHNGLYDAFVAKVNPAGTGLVYAGYIGGSGDDRGFGMAADDEGNAYLTGDTTSTETTFPATVGPDLTYNGGGGDAFVAKVNAAGTALVYAGYIGGADYDQGLGLARDSFDNVYVIGHTHSPEATFPVIDGPDPTFNGAGANGDAFITKVNATGSAFVYSGYIGGAGEDAAFWVAVDDLGDAYIVGDTDSNQSTFPDGDGFGSLPGQDQTQNGGVDGFIVKVLSS